MWLLLDDDGDGEWHASNAARARRAEGRGLQGQASQKCLERLWVIHVVADGILPHIVSEPTAADLAAGRDTELLRAIQFLGTGQ